MRGVDDDEFTSGGEIDLAVELLFPEVEPEGPGLAGFEHSGFECSHYCRTIEGTSHGVVALVGPGVWEQSGEILLGSLPDEDLGLSASAQD